MDEKKLKYSRSQIDDVARSANILDHVPAPSKFGRAFYVKCPKCGAFGKHKGKVKGMKLTDTNRMHIGKCFDCGASLNNAISAEMEFYNVGFIEAVEKCAATAGITLETELERRHRQAREAERIAEKESFVSRQLASSGLTIDDVMVKIIGKDGDATFAPVFRKGSMDLRGVENPDDDDMLIDYYDLFGKRVSFATRSNGSGLRNYTRIRWQFPSQHLTPDGKEVKYKTPKGAKARFYIPQKIRDLYEVSEEIETLIIQEGEKKAEKACKHGIPSIAIQGIFNIGTPQDGLMKELSYIVQKCKVRNVVLLFDSDWCDLSKELANGDAVDQRPKMFCKAAIKFKNYVESLHNEGIHVDVWFGHLNSTEEKGIDDLLAGSLKGKEETLREGIDEAMHAHNGKSSLVNIHKVSTLTDYQIRDFWHLNKFEDFIKVHSEALSSLQTIKCLNAYYARNEAGIFEAKTSAGDSAEFWEIEIDDNGKEKITFNPKKMINFLSVNGFARIHSLDTKEGQFDLVKSTNGVLHKSSLTEVMCYIDSFMATAAPEAAHIKMLDDFARIVTMPKVMTLPEIPDTTADTWPALQVFCYKTGFVSISPDGIETNAPGHLIWEESVIKRPFKRIPIISDFSYKDGKYKIKFTPEGEKCEFLEYLLDTSNMWHRSETQMKANLDDLYLHVINKMTCLGYMLHFYRPMNEAKAVIAMDYTESEVGESNGRSGKSLFGMAVSRMIPQAMVDGKNFDPKFMFSTVTPRTRNIFIDDVRPNFNLTDLYHAITGDMAVNVKSMGMYTIPRDLSPKIYLSTNHAIKGDDKSTQARKVLMGFSDYYNIDYSVADKFGHCFFADWDEEQWLLFDNLMCECVWLYLRIREYHMNADDVAEGLVNPPMVNLRHRELRQGMGESFLQWASAKFDKSTNLGVRKPRKELFEDYLSYDRHGGRFVTPQEFGKRIRRFCEYTGCHLNPHKPHEKTGETFTDWIKTHPGEIFAGKSDKSNSIEYYTITDPTGTIKQENPFADSGNPFE